MRIRFLSSFKFLLVLLLSMCLLLSACVNEPSKPDDGEDIVDDGPVIDDDVEFNNVKLGIDNIDDYLNLFEGKRVGLITNPTGVNSKYESTIDVLYSKVNLVSLFAPEHGIRGNAEAGGSIGNEIDAKTGLTVYSLYGNTNKPTKAMMDTIDVLCIDIQDVGARFYTYIYTMAYAMSACKDYDKTFVVFDRPNPASADVVQGNVLSTSFTSFIGMYPIVTRHGMTIGEIAKLFNEEYNIHCKLEIVKMTDYDRTKYYDEYDLPWISPSPNMPTIQTVVVYSGTCLFEGTNLSVARGTTKPFEYIGAPYIDPFLWSDRLNAMNLEGVYFRPIYFTPNTSTHANTQCGGVQVHVTNRDTFDAVKVAFAMYYTIRELYPNDFSFTSTFKLLTGCSYVYDMTYSLEDLYKKVDEDVNNFKQIRAKYLIY